jgi:hypothetical protein
LSCFNRDIFVDSRKQVHIASLFWTLFQLLFLIAVSA